MKGKKLRDTIGKYYNNLGVEKDFFHKTYKFPDLMMRKKPYI